MNNEKSEPQKSKLTSIRGALAGNKEELDKAMNARETEFNSKR